MKHIQFTLFADGSSDRALLPILETRLLRNRGLRLRRLPLPPRGRLLLREVK